MLKLFEVSGFKNFLSPIRIDFSDVKNYQFNENCICNNLLQKLIVYGKNASGKSNLGLALFDIVSHMTTNNCLLYTSPSPRDRQKSRMPSSA